MRKALAFVLAFTLVSTPLAGGVPAPAVSPTPPLQEESSYVPYTAEQLDNLLAPIALYPDPLLAQVLVAATFVDQIDEAARWVRSYGQSGVDDQPWDVSVRAVAHYPTVLSMMDDNLDWTTAVGQAYVYQSTDVMMSIQRLRTMAQTQGNLVTTPQQEVFVEDGYIYIWPASPRYLYVPIYDPSIIFFRRVYFPGFFSAVFSFGTGFLIGVWLNRDCDWRRHRIYYTGWQGRGWIARSRPFVRITPGYVNPRFSTIVTNRRVIQRRVNYTSIERYRSIHRNVGYENLRRGVAAPPPRPPERRVPNKIIDRNINRNDPRLDQFRGRQRQPAPTPAPAARPTPQPPTQPTTRPPARPTTQPPARPAPPPVKQPPATARPPAARPPAAPAARPPAQRPPTAFNRGDANFDSKAASQRGKASRQEAKQKPPAAKKPAPKRPPHPGGR
jgi:hypothetical protein